MKKILVTGAGGFIAGHLVAVLRDKGQKVRAVDIKPLDEWFQVFPDADNFVLDLRDKDSCYKAVDGCNEVFNLAADMGGMGFIELNKALCMISVLINTHLLMASRDIGVDRYFYSSSACVYNAEKQMDASPESPMVNGCFLIKNWGDEEPSIKVDGRVLKKGKEYQVGTIHTLEGGDLILWIEKTSTVPVKILIADQSN